MSALKQCLQPVKSEQSGPEDIPSLKTMLQYNQEECNKSLTKSVNSETQCMNEPGLKSLSNRRILTQVRFK